jgi:hypothetical protein
LLDQFNPALPSNLSLDGVTTVEKLNGETNADFDATQEATPEATAQAVCLRRQFLFSLDR